MIQEVYLILLLSVHEKVIYYFVFCSKGNGNFPICCSEDMIGIYWKIRFVINKRQNLDRRGISSHLKTHGFIDFEKLYDQQIGY